MCMKHLKRNVKEAKDIGMKQGYFGKKKISTKMGV